MQADKKKQEEQIAEIRKFKEEKARWETKAKKIEEKEKDIEDMKQKLSNRERALELERQEQ